jgi:hypothetical protein
MSCVKSRFIISSRPGETMQIPTALQPVDDFDPPIASQTKSQKFKPPLMKSHSRSGEKCGAKSGALGPIAAASSRRGAPSPAMPTPRAAKSADGKSGALVPLVLALSAFAAWALLVGERMQAVRLAPALAPAYAALGLPVNLREMDFENVASRIAEEDGRQILVVEGEIRNLAASARAAPRMRLAVLDAAGTEIYTWTATPQKSRLLAGEKAAFRARLAAPPQQGRDVRVRFAAEDSTGSDKPMAPAKASKAGFGS